MKITIQHPNDETLTATFATPAKVEDAWREYWRALTTATGDTMTGNFNLCLSFLESHDARGFVALCEEWSGLPELAAPHLAELAGQITFITSRGAAQFGAASGLVLTAEMKAEMASMYNSQVIDLRALLPIIESVADGERTEAIEASIAEHRPEIEALQKAGITADKIKGWLSRFREVLCLSTPLGVFVDRKPSRAALVANANQINRGSAYDAARSLVATCTLHPEVGLLPSIFASAPAACTALAGELSRMSDTTVAAIIKKE